MFIQKAIFHVIAGLSFGSFLETYSLLRFGRGTPETTHAIYQSSKLLC